MSETRHAPLAERVAIVTGAAHGIGLAIAWRLARDGAAVVLSDIDAAGLDAAVDELRGAGHAAAPAVADVRLPGETDAMVETARREFGALDVLVNNAGLVAGGTIETMTDDEWDVVLDVILRGSFNAIRSAAPLLMGSPTDPPAHHRKVVTISSVAGVHGGSTVNYSAAKAGQIGLSKGLAREWAEHRINVNVVAPGRIGGTQLGTSAMTAAGTAPVAMPEPEIPIGRTGRADDVADTVAFLAAPGSDYLTGQVIETHGGLPLMPRPTRRPAA